MNTKTLYQTSYGINHKVYIPIADRVNRDKMASTISKRELVTEFKEEKGDVEGIKRLIDVLDGYELNLNRVHSFYNNENIQDKVKELIDIVRMSKDVLSEMWEEA